MGVGLTQVQVQVLIDLSGTSYGGTFNPTDVSPYLITMGEPIEIGQWGRQDLISDLQVSQVTFELANDGRFTPRNSGPSGIYYPHVRRRARCRINLIVTTFSGDLAIVDTGDAGYRVTGPSGFATNLGDESYQFNVGTFTDLGDESYSIASTSTTVNYFDGFIDSWETVYSNGGYSNVTVSASDILGRLATDMPLRCIGYEEMLLDQPTSFYPLNDQGPSFADLLNVGPLITATPGFTGLGVNYQNVTLAPNVTSVYSDPNLVGVGLQGYFSFLAIPAPITLPAAFVMHFATNNTAFTNSLVSDDASNSVGIKTNGHISTSPTGPDVGSLPVNDGKVHQLALQGGTIWVDGIDSGVVHGLTNINSLGFNLVGTCWSVGFFPATLTSARLIDQFLANGGQGITTKPQFAGELTSVHAARMLGYRTNFGLVADVGLGKVGVHSTDGLTVQQALFDCADAEGGAVYGNGLGQVVFLNRNHMFSPPVTLTLDASKGQVAVTSVIRDDIAGLLNKVNVTIPSGATQTYADPTSIGQDGIVEDDLDLIIDNEAHALDAAKWRVQVGVQEQTSATQLDIDLFKIGDPSVVLRVLQLKPLDVVALANTRADMPTTNTYMVQGGKLTVGANTMIVSLFTTVVPAGDPY